MLKGSQRRGDHPYLTNISENGRQFEIWDLCDPESDTGPALPKEPIEPNWEGPKKDHPMDWFHVYGVMNTQYERKLSAYKKKLQGRKVVANAIRQSIHEKYQVFIDQETPWGLLRNLRQRVSPECNPTYRASLRAAWRNLDRGLDKTTDIDQWLLNWQILQKRCAKAGITEAREAPIQFLEAVSVISPEFHATWIVSAEIASASEKSDEEKQADFANLLTRYKAYWLMAHGKQAAQKGMSKAVFSTWQGHQEAQPGDSTTSSLASRSASKSAGKKSSDFPVEKRFCPCSKRGKPHPPWRCWAAFPEDKPAGMPDAHPDKKEAWDRAMKAEPLLKRSEQRRKTHRRTQFSRVER